MLEVTPPLDITHDEIDATKRKKLFLHYLAQTCNVTRSAELAEIERGLVYKWRENDATFASEWEAAKERGFERCEDEMHRRAYEGTVVATKSGIVREYSDTLAIFLSKAHKPERYNERVRTEISGPNGAPLNGDEHKIAAKLNSILNAVMQRGQKADAPDHEHDASDIV